MKKFIFILFVSSCLQSVFAADIIKKEKVSHVSGPTLCKYSVVVQSYALPSNASSLIKKLEDEGFNATLVKGVNSLMYRLTVASSNNLSKVEEACEKLKPHYPKAYILEVEGYKYKKDDSSSSVGLELGGKGYIYVHPMKSESIGGAFVGGTNYGWSPIPSDFILCENLIWSGSLVNGKINGNGHGTAIVKNGDIEMKILFSGNYKEGFPIGSVGYNTIWGNLSIKDSMEIGNMTDDKIVSVIVHGYNYFDIESNKNEEVSTFSYFIRNDGKALSQERYYTILEDFKNGYGLIKETAIGVPIKVNTSGNLLYDYKTACADIDAYCKSLLILNQSMDNKVSFNGRLLSRFEKMFNKKDENKKMEMVDELRRIQLINDNLNRSFTRYYDDNYYSWHESQYQNDSLTIARVRTALNEPSKFGFNSFMISAESKLLQKEKELATHYTTQKTNYEIEYANYKMRLRKIKARANQNSSSSSSGSYNSSSDTDANSISVPKIEDIKPGPHGRKIDSDVDYTDDDTYVFADGVSITVYHRYREGGGHSSFLSLGNSLNYYYPSNLSDMKYKTAEDAARAGWVYKKKNVKRTIGVIE